MSRRRASPGSRRRLLNGGAAFLAGGLIGNAAGVSSAAPKPPKAGTPDLPWKWARIDPMEAGSRAYRSYFDVGGCGSAAWLGVLSLVRDAVGYPWTVLPDRMFDTAQAGCGGQGTLCGALGVSAHFFNLVAFDEKKTYVAMTDDLFQWYSRTSFPTRRFDAISAFKEQVQQLAKSPLCHVSVSQWTLAAGAGVTSRQKKDSCAKVTGEVVHNVVVMLNAYAEGRYEPARYPFEQENAACLGQRTRCRGFSRLRAKSGSSILIQPGLSLASFEFQNVRLQEILKAIQTVIGA